MKVEWVETTREVYFAIYEQHCTDLVPHQTISYVGHPDYGYHMMTEWGFKRADAPVIKIDSRDINNRTQRYYIAAIKEDNG